MYVQIWYTIKSGVSTNFFLPKFDQKWRMHIIHVHRYQILPHLFRACKNIGDFFLFMSRFDKGNVSLTYLQGLNQYTGLPWRSEILVWLVVRMGTIWGGSSLGHLSSGCTGYSSQSGGQRSSSPARNGGEGHWYLRNEIMFSYVLLMKL